MNDQFIKQPPRRCRLSFCVFGAALTFAAGALTAHLLHGNELLLANKIARTANRRAADLQAEVDRTAAELAVQQRKNWELAIRIDELRQPFADLAELTAAVRKLHLPTLQPGKCKSVPKPKAAPPPSKLRFIPPPKIAPVPAAKQITAAHNKVRAAVGAVDAGAMVAAHNRWRAEVGVPGLRWSDELAAVAQGYVDKLAADGCKMPMQHSGNGYGENLYWHSASVAVDPRRPVDVWGAEKQLYSSETGRCAAAGKDTCGHYTQVVWKGTKEVGCGMAFCPCGGQIWGCNYSPAGNVVGRKPF